MFGRLTLRDYGDDLLLDNSDDFLGLIVVFG